MAVTSSNIAAALGVAAPASGSTTDVQWSMWIADVYMLIEARLGDVAALDQPRVEYVVREAVVMHVKRPDDATQVTVSVDDGSTSRTYTSGAGRLTILDEWWDLLVQTPAGGKAFEIDTMPATAGVLGVDYWWTTPTDITVLP